MNVLTTERLALRHLTHDDAEFILELVNEPAFIQNIGDKGVRSIGDARDYIENGPIASYTRLGFGLYRVELKATGVPIGMCGLVRRAGLEDVDIGYALLERFWGQGYAYEAAQAVMDYGRTVLGLPRIVAVIAPDNRASARVLEKLGLRFEKAIDLPGYDTESHLFT
jgi:ribosomal-protein-alanine N-acetyltransferase